MVCDGLKGLSEAMNTTWGQTVAQQCIVRLIRDSLRYTRHQHRDAFAVTFAGWFERTIH